MLVLGIDPGAVNVGYAFLEDGVLVKAGLFSPTFKETTLNGKTIEGMVALRNFLDRAEERIGHIDAIAVERVPTQHMGQRDRILGTENFLRSFAILGGRKYKEYAAVSVKKFVTGNYRASKGDVRQSVSEIFNLKEERGVKPDVFDAIAIAYTGFREGEWDEFTR